MVTRIALAAIVLTAGCSLAAAQSSTATSGTTQPMTSAPASNNTLPNGQPKWQPPPPRARARRAFRSGRTPSKASRWRSSG